MDNLKEQLRSALTQARDQGFIMSFSLRGRGEETKAMIHLKGERKVTTGSETLVFLASLGKTKVTPVTPMQMLEEEVDDIAIMGSEIAYRVSDLPKFFEGRNIPPKMRRRIFAASRHILKNVVLLGEIRVALGLKERPDN